MKNKFIKSLVVGVMIGLASSPVFAIDLSTTLNATNTFANLLNGAARISGITIINSGATAASTFAIYDMPSTNGNALATAVASANGNQYSNGAYLSITSYTTNLQVFATNSMGLSNFQVINFGGGTLTNNPVWRSNVLWTATNTVASVTNATYRLLFAGTLAAGGTTTITNQFNVTFGLTVTNTISTNIYNVTYSSAL